MHLRSAVVYCEITVSMDFQGGDKKAKATTNKLH